jgi:hypothetical protein
MVKQKGYAEINDVAVPSHVVDNIIYIQITNNNEHYAESDSHRK